MTWDAPSWRKAAINYRDSRADRSSVEPPRLARRLMADDISLDRAWRELNAARNREAPEWTVEALMYGLRESVAALRRRRDRLRRLSELSEAQLRVVCERLVNFKPHIAPAWTEGEVQALVKIWSDAHVEKIVA
jgi:hypothetical protein